LCLFTGTARAEITPTPGNLDHALEAVAKYYEAHPELEGWSSQSSQFKAEGDKAIASVENMENRYTGASNLESKPPTGLDTTSENHIKELVEVLSKEWDKLGTSEGSLTDSIGGEALDAAEGAGFVTGLTSSAAGIALGSIPLAATLAYEDITTGTNFVTVAVFSSQADYEKVEAQGGIAAEKVRWQRFPRLNCSSSQGLDACLETRIGEITGGGKVGGENWLFENKTRVAYESSGFDPEGLTVPSYYLEGEVGGHYYIVSNGMYGESLTLPEPDWPWEENKSGGCFVHNISGIPDHLYKGIATTVLVGSGGSSCGHGEPGHETSQYFVPTATARTPSRMHIGPPVHSSETAVKKLEEEGHAVKHLEGHTATPETEPETFKKLSEKYKEKGQRRLEEYECAHMKCEQEHVPSEPETELEPNLPEKPEGESPDVPGLVEVPNCIDIPTTGTECQAELEELGFTDIEIDPLTWETAVLTIPAGDTAITDPGAGSRVDTSTKIKVETNPDTEHMPEFVPRPDHKPETGTEYKEQLETEGWTKVEVKVLTESQPGAGPGESPSTDPSWDTRLDPDTSPKTDTVTVNVNPEAPAVVGPPTLPGFDIPNFGVVCKGFPFGVPCWLIGTIESWSTSQVCPRWGIEKLTIEGHEINGSKFNLCELEPIMEKVRPAMLIFATIGLVLLFYTFAKGGSPPSGSGTADLGGKEVTTEHDDDGTEYRVGW
jgi:hypothetical protein